MSAAPALSICVALPFLFPSPASAKRPEPSPQTAAVKKILKRSLRNRKLAGIAAIVVRSDTVIGIGVAGVRCIGQPAKLDSTDLFHLGSNTKAVTATMIARLVEKGTLSWDTTPADIFLELNSKMHPAFRRITIEQLLSHHAGMSPYTSPESWPKLPGDATEQRYRFSERALASEPAATPGTKALYSNAGPVIVAAMAERKTGLTWEQLVTTEVLEPLKIHAIFGFPLSASPNQPCGHIETEQGVTAVRGGAVDLPSYLFPAGGLAMSLTDYGKFLGMNVKGLRGEDDTFLSAHTVRRLHTSPLGDEYALGWGIYHWDGTATSTHAGSAGSFYALSALQPELNQGVAVILNSGGKRTSQAAEEALMALLNE